MNFANDAAFEDDFRKVGEDVTAAFERPGAPANPTEFANSENLLAIGKGRSVDDPSVDEDDDDPEEEEDEPEDDDLEDDDEEELDEEDDDEFEDEDDEFDDDDEEDEDDDEDEENE